MFYHIEANVIGMFPSVGDTIYLSSTVYQDHSVIGPFKVVNRSDCHVRQIIPSFIRAKLEPTGLGPNHWVYPGRKVEAVVYPCPKEQAKAWADYEADSEAHQG